MVALCSSVISRSTEKDSGAEFRAFALLRSVKKVRNVGKTFQSSAKKEANLPPKGFDVSEDNTGDENEDGFNTFNEPVRDNLSSNSSPASPARDTVLTACTITSGVLVALGLLIRQASHVASMEGWPILDASAEVSFNHLLNFSWLRDAARPINDWNGSIGIFLPLYTIEGMARIC